MGIEIRSHFVTLNETLPPFEFSGRIGASVYGITRFYNSFGKTTNREVQSVSISLNNLGTNGNSMMLDYIVHFQDNSSRSYDPINSFLEVTVVAWIGENASSNVALSNYPDSITNDSPSAPINLGGVPISINALLAGFDLAYDNSAHYMQRFYATSGLLRSGSDVRLKATAGMSDNSGHQASTANVNVGLLATLVANPGFETQIVSIGQTVVTFSQDVDEVGAILMNFDMQYNNDDYRISNVYAVAIVYRTKPPYPPSVPFTPKPNNALIEANASMRDSRDNHIAASSMNVLVIGRYKSKT